MYSLCSDVNINVYNIYSFCSDVHINVCNLYGSSSDVNINVYDLYSLCSDVHINVYNLRSDVQIKFNQIRINSLNPLGAKKNIYKKVRRWAVSDN